MVLLGGPNRTYVDTVVMTGSEYAYDNGRHAFNDVYKFIVYYVEGDGYIAYVFKKTLHGYHASATWKCIGRKDCNYPRIGAFPQSTTLPRLGPGVWHHDTYGP